MIFMNNAKQNVKIKPFKWADLTLIVQYEYCPQCKYFSNCYDIKELVCEYDGRSRVVKKVPNYISQDCFEEATE
jgi:hypothetical protein